MSNTDFRAYFDDLTGHSPFPWQERVFVCMVAGDLPGACDIPTGLGKTSTMATWLIALALADKAAWKRIPRRLVYVVDRRAVVDQATAEAEKIRDRLEEHPELKTRLGLENGKLPISTLRGQFADNRDWLIDPSTPAIIVGTVDMVGSRLLFSGYGVSSKMRPYHAGFLGADTLVVLDEAHLVPPFERLLESIDDGTDSFGPRGVEDRKLIPPFRLLSLSATGRERRDEPSRIIRLDEDDRQQAVVKERLDASKRLTIDEPKADRASLVDDLAKKAWALGVESGSPRRVLVYCDSRDVAVEVKHKIDKRLAKTQFANEPRSELLVGERRVMEREALFNWLVTHGFASDQGRAGPSADTVPPPAFLVATSAGEVGVDLDADDMVCDLVEWERMVQRFGRVNRRGKKDSRIEVVVPPAKDRGPEADRFAKLAAAVALLEGDASPGRIDGLKLQGMHYETLRRATTAPPLRPALTRALVDAWSMTSLEMHAGRPDDIQPWLRGWDEDPKPQATLVWRKYLPVRERDGAPADRKRDVEHAKDINAFFEAAPPERTEMLEAEVWHIEKWLEARIATASKAAGKAAREPAAIGENDTVLIVLNRKGEIATGGGGRLAQWSLSEVAALLEMKPQDKARKEFVTGLTGHTLMVRAELAGLRDGRLANDEDQPPSTIEDEERWTAPFRVRETDNRDNPGDPGAKSIGSPSTRPRTERNPAGSSSTNGSNRRGVRMDAHLGAFNCLKIIRNGPRGARADSRKDWACLRPMPTCSRSRRDSTTKASGPGAGSARSTPRA